MQTICAELKAQGKKVGFVPTMGFLHVGHLSLVNRSLKDCSVTVVSIFVNPSQFAPHEDLDRYPRDIKRDIKHLHQLDVDLLFTPTKDAIYPEPYLTTITVDEITRVGEGMSRPTFFRGVTTIVAKLLNIVQPSVMYLGQKDIQQAIILRKMIQDLNMPLSVKICPTVREKDGLAVSSRNVYLSASERESAQALITALRTAETIIGSGETNCNKIIRKMTAVYKQFPAARIDYILCADFESFKPVKKVESRCIIATAAYIGSTRLIDNIIISSPRRPN